MTLTTPVQSRGPVGNEFSYLVFSHETYYSNYTLRRACLAKNTHNLQKALRNLCVLNGNFFLNNGNLIQ
jgi:hypothetical protein